ncbi:hypothetical protein VTO73DRAFT_9946 [Trametes versicolor]
MKSVWGREENGERRVGKEKEGEDEGTSLREIYDLDRGDGRESFRRTVRRRALLLFLLVLRPPSARHVIPARNVFRDPVVDVQRSEQPALQRAPSAGRGVTCVYGGADAYSQARIPLQTLSPLPFVPLPGRFSLPATRSPVFVSTTPLVDRRPASSPRHPRLVSPGPSARPSFPAPSLG